MSKGSKIALVLVLVVVTVAAIFGVFSIYKIATKEYVNLTAEDFIVKMESKGFSTDSMPSENEEYVELVVAKNGNYEVEYMYFDDLVEAKYKYAELKYDVENMRGSSYSQSETNINNMQKKSLSSDGRYGYVCRINNSIIYVNTDNTYQKEIKELMKELGY